MTDEAKALEFNLPLARKLVDNPKTQLPAKMQRQAVDLIETQAREIEQLSYALGCIANEDWKDMTVGSARDLARAALGDSYDQ